MAPGTEHRPEPEPPVEMPDAGPGADASRADGRPRIGDEQTAVVRRLARRVKLEHGPLPDRLGE